MTKRPAGRAAPARKTARKPIDEYIAGAPAEARPILRKIRAIVHEEAPGAEERISYRIPAFFQGEPIVYFAAFTHHIGMFPPVKREPALEKALAKYRGPKGNLRFPLDEPIPYPLIRRVVKARLKAVRAKQAPAKQSPAKRR
jgi:uncharacterized protein YdhG (YjbR/CyaY superfamily)